MKFGSSKTLRWQYPSQFFTWITPLVFIISTVIPFSLNVYNFVSRQFLSLFFILKISVYRSTHISSFFSQLDCTCVALAFCPWYPVVLCTQVSHNKHFRKYKIHLLTVFICTEVQGQTSSPTLLICNHISIKRCSLSVLLTLE